MKKSLNRATFSFELRFVSQGQIAQHSGGSVSHPASTAQPKAI